MCSTSKNQQLPRRSCSAAMEKHSKNSKQQNSTWRNKIYMKDYGNYLQNKLNLNSNRFFMLNARLWISIKVEPILSYSLNRSSNSTNKIAMSPISWLKSIKKQYRTAYNRLSKSVRTSRIFKKSIRYWLQKILITTKPEIWRSAPLIY